ncbi:DUF4240 domain-containing protein [Yoonia maritima]|uniref:DUF4240 domain-containing protein n=1 Tax=Yoonia maritima TaxID=1435347 RepID=UPI0037365369
MEILDYETFWKIIDDTRGAGRDGQDELLRLALLKKTPEIISMFAARYQDALDRAYRWDLWAAAYIINGGCSDDGFDYFCDWLISRGRDVFEAAIADPESLANLDDLEDVFFEEFRYVSSLAYEQLTGDDLALPKSKKCKPDGQKFDERTVGQLFPRLVGEQTAQTDELRSSQEIEIAFDGVLAELVGKRLTSIAPVLTPGPFRKTDGIAFYFALGRPRLEAKAWTVECTDRENLSTLELAKSEMREANQPSGEETISSKRARIVDATQELFAGKSGTRITVKTAQHVGQGDLRITLENTPFCRSIVLHGFDNSDGNSNLAVLVKQDDDYYYHSPCGLERRRPK